MHRLIMKTPQNLTVEHIDGDGLNNQKINLKNCSQSENSQNKKTINKHGIKGVYYKNGKWYARINCIFGPLKSKEKAGTLYSDVMKTIRKKINS